MDNKIKLIIDDYIEKVNVVCHKLLNGINIQENLNLKTKWDFFEYRSKNRKMEFDIDGIKYRLHGNGCFALSDELFLNWNFGYRSRWCGIDPWILGMTLKENNNMHVEYYDGSLIKEACVQAILDGEMFEKHGLYHFSIPIDETFIPNFPQDFDTMIIENSDNKWILSKNNVIDRFLRKSNHIYNHIYNSENAYILRFIAENKEIYTIPYDDICYPEKAIKIMSDDILWNLESQSIKK